MSTDIFGPWKVKSGFDFSIVDPSDKKKRDDPATIIDSFSEILSQSLGKVNDLQNEAADMTRRLAAGEVDNIHDVMITAQKARLALDFTLQLRQLIIGAYNKLEQMR